jgi:hypothetical protein
MTCRLGRIVTRRLARSGRRRHASLFFVVPRVVCVIGYNTEHVLFFISTNDNILLAFDITKPSFIEQEGFTRGISWRSPGYRR